MNLLSFSSFPSSSHSHSHHGSAQFVCVFSTVSSNVCADAQCKTNAKADIVLLVDGSWSIGRMNFKTIRNFIARTVGVFDIGPNRVQIGRWWLQRAGRRA